MTPPDSPEKAAGGGRAVSDFHPMIDVRGPPLTFDIRQGMHLSGAAASQPALNHPAALLVVNIGPGLFTVEITPARGATVITLGDVYGQLTAAMKARASPAELTQAALQGFSIATQVPPHATRATMMHVRVGFAGFSLRCVQQGVAYADCHLL